MYVSPYKYAEKVTSEPLEVVSFAPYSTLSEWMRGMRRKYQVNLSFSTDDPRNSVRISGPYGNVFSFIAKEWGDNETDEMMQVFVDAMLGDRLATFYWLGHKDEDSKSAFEKLAWREHFNVAGYGSAFEAGDDNPMMADANEWAIEVLATLGEAPDFTFKGDGNSVDMATSYLQLAALHVPKLTGFKPVEKPPFEYVTLDAFNLFKGAAFMFAPDKSERIWIVMEFTDSGEGALSLADEKVLVRLREAPQEDVDVKVRDWIFDYNDKVYLLGSVRNAHDLDDNNWGQNL